MIFPLVAGLEETCFGRIDSQTHVPSHLHHFFQLDVILEGTVTVTLENRIKQNCRRGDCLLIPPLVLHGYDTRQGFRQATFKFFLTPRFWTLFNGPAQCIRLSEPLLKNLEMAARTLSGKNPVDGSRILAMLTLCLGEVSDYSAEKPLSPDNLDAFREKLWPLLEKIAQEPLRKWTVSEMAARCHLQADYFSRSFQKVLGKTPRDYLLEVRMREAAGLLLGGGNLTIEAVADKSGYFSLHAFTRAFKQAIGLSPAAYRRTPPEFARSDSVKSLSFRGKDI
jgi:AraC-like DNA-binding protein